MNATQLVKSKVNKENILKLLQDNGAKHITPLDDSFRCTCPLHKGDNPTAFTWNYKNGLWFCFTGDCGGGDIFDFIADVYEMSPEHEFKEIVKKTAELLEIDITGIDIGNRTSQHVKELREWKEFVSKKQRVINPEYNLNKLGELKDLTKYRHFTKDTIDYFKASFSLTHNRVVVPLFDEKNIVVGASLRKTDEEEVSKWLHKPKHMNTRYLLYNLDSVKASGIALLTEGPFDVWNLYQIGVPISVATFGAHLTDEQEELIMKYFTDIILGFDNDKAGRNATRNAIEILKHKVNLSVLDIAPYKDCGEIPDLDTYNKLPRLKWYEWINKYGLKE